MTPVETVMTMEANAWRVERERKSDLAMAWTTAVLSRVKRVPALAQLLSGGQAKKLGGKELDRRREEFKEMTSGVDVSKLTRKNADSTR